MITKYAKDSIYTFEDESVAVLYEFFGGHPRTSLSSCSAAIEIAGNVTMPVSPRVMAKACLGVQRRIAAYKSMAQETNDG